MANDHNPRFELLVGADEFMERLEQDAQRAQKRFYVQTMTWEGDTAGKRLADCLLGSGAKDRRTLVDCYGDHIISDQIIWSPAGRRNDALQKEVLQTRRMFEELEHAGVDVRKTNPTGPLLLRFPQRNHKKILIVDNAAYIGGINFSDHNFEWHDLMVRIADQELIELLAQDFLYSFEGKPTSEVHKRDQVTLYTAGGQDNARIFSEFLNRFQSVERSVDVVSPYLTFPFTDCLGKLVERGIRVQLLTPQANNKTLVRDYLVWEAERLGLSAYVAPQMSHMKAMVIDDSSLVIGSTNFDFVSYHAQAEILLEIQDPTLVKTFRERVWEPDLKNATRLDTKASSLRGVSSWLALQTLSLLTRFSNVLPAPQTRVFGTGL